MKKPGAELKPTEILVPIVEMFRSHLVYMSRYLKSYGFNWVHFEFLMYLYHKEEGISQENLAKVFMVSKATSTRTIQKLESEGYVSRTRDESDRRAYKVYLTDKGRDIQEIIWPKLLDWVDIVFSDFDYEERETFKKMLKKACYKARIVRNSILADDTMK